MGCPSLNELLDFAQERLAPLEREAVQTHLATGCPLCRKEQGWLTEVLRLTAEDRSFDFSEDVIGRVVAWMHPKASAPAAAEQSPLRRFVAQLLFDSLMPRQFADVRSGSAATDAAGRQMLYHAAGYDIDLRFELTEDGAAEELIGQILPGEPSMTAPVEFTVRLLRDQLETGRVQADARGIFRFTQIPSGVYDLKIEAHGVEIEIPHAGSTRAS